MISKIIVGLQFGDEGKGLVTDYLCSQTKNPLVIRFCGGQQAGHTVVNNKLRHVFSNFGSGTLKGIPTYWSKYCTVDPIGIVNELIILKEKGVDPFLYIDKICPVTTPYDKVHNQNNRINNTHGTVGVGVGSTIEREKAGYSLLFKDLFYPEILNIKLELIKDYYKQGDNHKQFKDYCHYIIYSKNVKLGKFLPIKKYNCIFEGAQGLLLDQNFGFFPHVTRANTGTRNVIDMGYKPKIYMVTRAYQTRHGNGPMTNENIPHNIRINPDETNGEHPYQGIFRRSLLDLDLLLYGIDRDDYIKQSKDKTLIITCLDHVKNEYRFTHKGNIVCCTDENEFITRIKDILNIDKVLTSRSPYSDNIK